MTYKLTTTEKQGYLHFLVTGKNSAENMDRSLEEVWFECSKRSCEYALLEGRLEGPPLDVLDVFEIASKWSVRGRGTIRAIAYASATANPKLMKFAEDVTIHRALPVAMFSTIPEAEKWLLAQMRN